jgi:hypothetical protein
VPCPSAFSPPFDKVPHEAALYAHCYPVRQDHTTLTVCRVATKSGYVTCHEQIGGLTLGSDVKAKPCTEAERERIVRTDLSPREWH